MDHKNLNEKNKETHTLKHARKAIGDFFKTLESLSKFIYNTLMIFPNLGKFIRKNASRVAKYIDKNSKKNRSGPTAKVIQNREISSNTTNQVESLRASNPSRRTSIQSDLSGKNQDIEGSKRGSLRIKQK